MGDRRRDRRLTDSVSIAEVEAMPSLLKGIARLYHEVLHPIPGPPPAGPRS